MNLLVAHKAKQISKDPIGFILDRILAVVVNMLIPIPLAEEVVAQFKVPLLGALATFVLLAIFMVTVIFTIISLPFLSSSGYLQQVISSIFQPNSLNIAQDTSFVSTNVPKQNPFGGSGMNYTNITAFYHDSSYYLTFGKQHTGLDLVPSDDYFQHSKTYQDTHKIVIFATMNGTVNHYVDEYGGETVEITNSDSSIRVKYIHFSTVLVESGTISPGTPVGIMGETGFATGEHVHYEIQHKDGSYWVTVDPLNYIQ